MVGWKTIIGSMGNKWSELFNNKGARVIKQTSGNYGEDKNCKERNASLNKDFFLVIPRLH
jgi:hypothetical protein